MGKLESCQQKMLESTEQAALAEKKRDQRQQEELCGSCSCVEKVGFALEHILRGIRMPYRLFCRRLRALELLVVVVVVAVAGAVAAVDAAVDVVVVFCSTPKPGLTLIAVTTQPSR